MMYRSSVLQLYSPRYLLLDWKSSIKRTMHRSHCTQIISKSVVFSGRLVKCDVFLKLVSAHSSSAFVAEAADMLRSGAPGSSTVVIARVSPICPSRSKMCEILIDSLQLAPCDQSILVDVGDVLPTFIQQGHFENSPPLPCIFWSSSMAIVTGLMSPALTSDTICKHLPSLITTA